MDKTSVKAEFVILGNFSPKEITLKLQLEPTTEWSKGEILKNGRIREQSCWEISTAYEESLDITEQLSQVVLQIREKEAELIDLRESMGVEFLFLLVVKIENGETPAMTLERGLLDFAHAIQAEFEFDLYANPYLDPDSE